MRAAQCEDGRAARDARRCRRAPSPRLACLLLFFKLQSRMCHTLYHSDRSVLLGAAPGNGKFCAALLAVLRALRQAAKVRCSTWPRSSAMSTVRLRSSSFSLRFMGRHRTTTCAAAASPRLSARATRRTGEGGGGGGWAVRGGEGTRRALTQSSLLAASPFLPPALAMRDPNRAPQATLPKSVPPRLLGTGTRVQEDLQTDKVGRWIFKNNFSLSRTKRQTTIALWLKGSGAGTAAQASQAGRAARGTRRGGLAGKERAPKAARGPLRLAIA